MEVVGVVGDVTQGLGLDPKAEMYLPYRQADQLLPVFQLSVVLRTAGDPHQQAAALRSAIAEIDPNQPLVRGLWVAANGAAIRTAVDKKLFSRAAKAPLAAEADLAQRAEQALVARMLGDLGIARRSGALVLGFENVVRQREGPKPPKVLIEAFDGAPDGKRKLYAAAHRLELDCMVIETLTSAELGLALGRENVIHAAVQRGGLADRLIFDAERLSGFREAPSERDS